jgi:hypothetical protein
LASAIDHPDAAGWSKRGPDESLHVRTSRAEEADMLTLESRTDELRRQAIERIKKRSEFWSHLAAFLLFNGLIIAIWFAVSDGGFFWPIFPLAGWGIGLFFHGMDVFRRPVSEEQIRREMSRLS